MADNILFVLPAGGYSGGANSVVQETKGLRRIGQNVSIAVDQKNIASFRRCYATEFDILGQTLMFKDYSDLEKCLPNFDIVIATVGTHATKVFDTVRRVNAKAKRNIRLGYYIQDYEPLFFAKGSSDWQLARDSYDHAKDVICFAKTDWICRMVEKNHGIKVKRVLPSIDHDCYVPAMDLPSGIVLSAMVRTGTPRRAPRRTARVLGRLAQRYGSKIKLVTFGSTHEELAEEGLMLPASVSHQGLLTREQVAQVLRESSLFLDLSDYQAFGRTGIEAMACGAVPVMPVAGGACEFVTEKENGFLTDCRLDDLVIDVIDGYFNLPEKRRIIIRFNAIETAAQYNIHRAAVTLLQALS